MTEELFITYMESLIDLGANAIGLSNSFDDFSTLKVNPKLKTKFNIIRHCSSDISNHNKVLIATNGCTWKNHSIKTSYGTYFFAKILYN